MMYLVLPPHDMHGFDDPQACLKKMSCVLLYQGFWILGAFDLPDVSNIFF